VVRQREVARSRPAHPHDPPTDRDAYGDDVQARTLQRERRRAPQGHAGTGVAARLRELGPHARALWPVVRPGERGVGEGDRSPLAGDARAGMSAAPPTANLDGRRQRSERTRELIIEAYLALLRETPKIPTSSQIAERAGYSVRSVFERFPDLLTLRIA